MMQDCSLASLRITSDWNRNRFSLDVSFLDVGAPRLSLTPPTMR